MSPQISPDQLVHDYLAAVDRALSTLTALPAERRGELLYGVRDRIAAQRAALTAPDGGGVHAILDRLGDPATVAAALVAAARTRPGGSGASTVPAHTVAALTTPTLVVSALTAPTLGAPIITAPGEPTGRRWGPLTWAWLVLAAVAVLLLCVAGIGALLSHGR
jgi:hypothetical protein